MAKTTRVVKCLAVNHSSGEVVAATSEYADDGTSSGAVNVWSINGRPIAARRAALTGARGEVVESEVVSLALSEGPEWLDTNVVVTGTLDGSIQMWSVVPTGATAGTASSANQQQVEETHQELSYRLILRWKRARAHPNPVVKLLFSPNDAELFSGDESGAVLNWTLA